MENYKTAMRAIGLALLIVGGGIFNNTWAMEQPPKPIYEILAEKKVNELRDERERNIVKYPLSFEPFDSEKVHSQLVEKYKQYESYLEKIRNSPELSSIASSLLTGITYAMTLEEMKQKIKEKFSEMKKNGLIISKDEIESIKDKYYHHDTAHLSAHQDLTRIWGTEFLKKKISEFPYLSKNYDVPGYIIVGDDLSKISVDISFSAGGIFPIVATLNNGKIYFEKITGDRVASWNNRMLVSDLGVHGTSGIGYDDFSDRGNIIKQAGTNKYYIIDTEERNFKRDMDERLKEILKYAADRFRYLNPGEDRRTYEFDL